MDIDAQIAELERDIAQREEQQQQGGQQQQQQQQQQPGPGGDPANRRFAKDSDDRSVYVANLPVDQNLTAEEVGNFFSECGPVANCTLLRDRATNNLKGTAYVEFQTYEGVGRALDAKQNAVFRGQTLMITKKRSNFNPTRARGTGGARGGRGGGDPMAQMMNMMAGAMASMMGGRGGRGRGAGRGGFRGGRGGGRGGRGGRGGGEQGGAPGGGGFQPFQ